MRYDSTNPVLPVNRAMAYLKLAKYGKAEADCSTALSLDGKNVKALWRRGMAKRHQERYADAYEGMHGDA